MPKYKEYFRFNFLIILFFYIIYKLKFFIIIKHSIYFYNFLLFYGKNDLINIRYSLNFLILKEEILTNL